jgi:hypothetical protein
MESEPCPQIKQKPGAKRVEADTNPFLAKGGSLLKS